MTFQAGDRVSLTDAFKRTFLLRSLWPATPWPGTVEEVSTFEGAPMVWVRWDREHEGRRAEISRMCYLPERLRLL